jgi:hypothetical protein
MISNDLVPILIRIVDRLWQATLQLYGATA